MAAKKNIIKNVGACLASIEGKDVAPNATLELSDEQLKSQGVFYLFNRGEIEFEDDPKRTREFVEAGLKARNPKPAEPEKTLKELENAPPVE